MSKQESEMCKVKPKDKLSIVKSDNEIVIIIEGSIVGDIDDLALYQHIVSAINKSTTTEHGNIGEVKIRLSQGASMPEKVNNKYILRSLKKVTINPMRTELVDTGVRVISSDGYEVQVRAMNGTIIAHIDVDFDSTIKFPMSNNGSEPVVIEENTKIGQMIILLQPTVSLVED